MDREGVAGCVAGGLVGTDGGGLVRVLYFFVRRAFERGVRLGKVGNAAQEDQIPGAL